MINRDYLSDPRHRSFRGLQPTMANPVSEQDTT
jgi:hypothetical protein